MARWGAVTDALSAFAASFDEERGVCPGALASISRGAVEGKGLLSNYARQWQRRALRSSTEHSARPASHSQTTTRSLSPSIQDLRPLRPVAL